VRLWDPATGESAGHPLTGHTRGVTAVALGQLPDRTLLATGSADNTVRCGTRPPASRPATRSPATPVG
jgi:hypothetical protein